MDIISLTETKRKGKGSEEVGNYVHIYCGVGREERAQSGVSIAIRKNLKKFIKSWEQISDRIMQVQLDIMNNPVVIISAYAPNEDAADDKKDKFYDDLTRLLESTSNRKEIILTGDLNSRTGRQYNDPVVGGCNALAAPATVNR